MAKDSKGSFKVEDVDGISHESKLTYKKDMFILLVSKEKNIKDHLIFKGVENKVVF